VLRLSEGCQIVPDCDAGFVAGFGQTQKSIVAITAKVVACPGVDLAPCDVAPDVVFRAVGMQRISGRSSSISNSPLFACNRVSNPS
jgi:hypothetical protein